MKTTPKIKTDPKMKMTPKMKTTPKIQSPVKRDLEAPQGARSKRRRTKATKHPLLEDGWGEQL